MIERPRIGESTTKFSSSQKSAIQFTTDTYLQNELSKTVDHSKTFPIDAVRIGGLAFVVINSSPGHNLRATVTLDEEPEKLSLTKTHTRHAIKLHEHLEFRFPWGPYIQFECWEIIEIDSRVRWLC